MVIMALIILILLLLLLLKNAFALPLLLIVIGIGLFLSGNWFVGGLCLISGGLSAFFDWLNTYC